MNTLVEVGQRFGQIVVKVGGGCLVDEAAYFAIAKSIAWFQQQTGAHVLVVVSAAYDVTDKRIVLARQIDLRAWGKDDPFNADLLGVDADKLLSRLQGADISVMPGYFALDQLTGRRVLAGRNATDWIAVLLAGALSVPCILCKDGGAIFALDPSLIPGRLPLAVSELSHHQAYLFAESGHQFVMPGCLRLAERLDVVIRLLPSPTAKDVWQVKAIIGQHSATGGLLLGLKKDSHVDGIPSARVTVIELGEPRLNGQLTHLVSRFPFAAVVRQQGSQTKIYLARERVQPLVSLLANELNLLQPV